MYIGHLRVEVQYDAYYVCTLETKGKLVAFWRVRLNWKDRSLGPHPSHYISFHPHNDFHIADNGCGYKWNMDFLVEAKGKRESNAACGRNGKQRQELIWDEGNSICL